MLIYILCRYNFIIHWVTCLNVRQSPLYTRQNKHLLFDGKIPNLNIHLSQYNVKFWPVDIPTLPKAQIGIQLALTYQSEPKTLALQLFSKLAKNTQKSPPTWIINDIIMARTGSCCSFMLPNNSVVSRSSIQCLHMLLSYCLMMRTMSVI